MFSNLVQIFTPQPRQAESSNTRLEIRRHDPDQERRRRPKQEEEEKVRFNTYDNATVNVESLRVFLENFLKSLEKKESQNFIPDQGRGEEVQASSGLKNFHGESAVAAGAYRAAARTSPVASARAPGSPEAEQALLGNEDVRTIYALLRDIETLKSRRIDYLYIERGDTFLASLADAVRRALQN
ncbi:MAG: hypothetical protein IT558_03800 [Alphaproteobacteria bacterium]|nr:hypothetical protein [Alphaproteobacteria bacterium]